MTYQCLVYCSFLLMRIRLLCFLKRMFVAYELLLCFCRYFLLRLCKYTSRLLIILLSSLFKGAEK